MKFIFYIAACILFVAVNIVGHSIYQPTLGIGFNPADNSSVAALAAAMLSGIFASTIVSALKTMPQRKRVNFRNLLNSLLWPNTFIALILSPITFYSVLVSIGDGNVGILLYLAAFQNGFFWQTTMSLASPSSKATSPNIRPRITRRSSQRADQV